MLSATLCSASRDDSRNEVRRKFIVINSRLEIAHCSEAPNDKKKISIWYPSLITRNSSRAWQPLSRVNVTGLLRRLQVKIENIYLFKTLIKKKHGNVFKSWLCPNFLLLPKNSELPKNLGWLQPPSPPGPYAYDDFNLNHHRYYKLFSGIRAPGPSSSS